MLDPQDIERGEGYNPDVVDAEREALLPTETTTKESFGASATLPPSQSSRPRFGVGHLVSAFSAGILACLLAQFVICGPKCFRLHSSGGSGYSTASDLRVAQPDAGSTERHHFPPVSPTNVFPSLFPTRVGHAGSTHTGAEPAVVATAPSYPIHTGAAQLVVPASLSQTPSGGSHVFDLFKKWGNLSPWYSVGRKAFGLDSDPETPETCRITGLHLLHRHGARYPTAWSPYGGPAALAGRLHDAASQWNASGELEFLNEWTYKLGEEILTPFGRQQLLDLGVTMRLKYGFLLQNFTESKTIPVFRTESQNRMLASAMNFAIGFFGYPFQDKYQESVTLEAEGFNNTLSPYKTCPNAKNSSKADRALSYLKQWTSIYLKDAQARLQSQLHGYNITIEDLYALQQMCPYETVALGYSKFCELFTQDEWEGFNYALDLTFWYNSAFGSPVARVQGIGYVQELVARLTHTPIETHNSSTNATLDDNPITFPLGQSLYVDATHEVVILNIITALNLSNFASSGPLPADHIPPNRSFKVSTLAPFATNVQFQLLECTSVPGPQIRIIINDGVVPLMGIRGCPEQQDGMCPVDTFVAAQRETIGKTDWVYDCHGDWEVPEGPAWNTTTGDSPKS